MTTKPTRPVVRYPGGKWKQGKWLIDRFPDHTTFIDVFGGGANVLMQKKPSNVEVYNDLDDEVVNLFRVLRNHDQSAELRRLLALTPYSRTEFANAYEYSDDPIEQARRTVVLFSMSHDPGAAVMRLASSFRSSTGDSHRLPQDFQRSNEHLQTVTKRLINVIIENEDYRLVMNKYDHEHALHYVDPPYLKRRRRRKYYKKEMLEKHQHRELCEFLLTMKGFVILSGYNCPEYDEWLPGWVRDTTTATTGAATTGDSTATEVIWMNPRTAAAQRVQKLFDL